MQKLKMFGFQYYVDFVKERYEQYQQEIAFKIYLTDYVQFLSKWVVTALGRDVETKRYYDLISNKEKVKEKTCDEIKKDLEERGAFTIIRKGE